MSQNDQNNGLEIAVIGMAGRFPGAKNIEQFWDNLKNGVESITFYSKEELQSAGFSTDLLNNPNYVMCGGGTLENIEYFDAAFFGYSPVEAELTDPQVRIFHECAWHALENAGYDPFSSDKLIGLYAGASFNLTWEAAAMMSGKSSILGNFTTQLLLDRDYLCTRVSYNLNLKGPSVVVKTACSTSLVAVHMACQSILNGECDMALAGGVTITRIKKEGYMYQEGMILSQDGHCRSFDEHSLGTVSGDGVGAVVLKRLEEAIDDRDSILAVIKGSAINNDGERKVGFTAPSVDGQCEVICDALQIAGVDPETITYVETHGTGTPVGDPIEIEALKLAFNTSKKHYCRIGSVKTNVGHLDAAAGIAGFIKTVLALKHQLIPPSLHFKSSNPRIDFENSPFIVNTELFEWKNNGQPLRAGVSSFGIGGTNAHIVLEEYLNQEKKGTGKKIQLILLSAKSQTALNQMTENLAGFLKENKDTDLADVAYTLQIGRSAFPYRRMAVCADIENAIKILSLSGSSESNKARTSHTKDEKKSVIFMFPGLGSEYVNMGLELYQAELIFREKMDQCFNILNSIVSYDVKAILYPGETGNGNSKMSPGLHQPEIVQTVLFIFEYALAGLLMHWGIKPHALIGYSFGEYTAACLAGVFSLEDALNVIVARGKLIGKLPTGTMLSVPLPREELKPFLTDELAIAIDNGPSCIIAGPDNALAVCQNELKKERCLCIPLPNSHAIHSPMMNPILKDLETHFKKIALNKPQIPYISNVTGDWITVRDATNPGYWAAHLKETVRFADGIKQLMKEPNPIFIEIGPGRDLSALLVRHKEGDAHPKYRAVSLVKPVHDHTPDSYYFLNKLGQLWLYGIKIDWKEFHDDKQDLKPCRIPLPLYPFEGRKYWLDIDPFKAGMTLMENPLTAKKKDTVDWLYTQQWRRSSLLEKRDDPLDCSPVQTTWLLFSDDSPLGTRLVKRLEKDNHPIIVVTAGERFHEIKPGKEYTVNPGVPDDYDNLFKTLAEMGKAPANIAHLWCLARLVGNRKQYPDLETSSSSFDPVLELGLFSLLDIARAIGKTNIPEKIKLGVVTGNMQYVTGEEELVPEKAAILGPVKIIPLEYTNISCRSIDILNPGEDKVKIEFIIENLLREFSTDFEDQPVVAYRGACRWLESYEPVTPNREKRSPIESRLKEKGIYLVTGGFGGMGFALAEHLVHTLNARLIVVDILTPPTCEKLDAWLYSEERKKDIAAKKQKIEEWRSQGSEILVYDMDVSNYQGMKAIISQVEAQLGQINGVIHAAGLIDYAGVIQRRTREMTEALLAAKIKGTLVLDALLAQLPHPPLDFMVLFSSIGNPYYKIKFGQVGYNAGHEFMDIFAYYKQQQGQFTVTIDWNDWTEVGMAVRSANRHSSQSHNFPVGRKENESLLAISPAEGIDVFKRILEQNAARVVVFHHDLNRLLELMNNPAEAENQIRSLDGLDGAGEHGEHCENGEDTEKLYERPELSSNYVPPSDELEQFIVSIWEKTFGFKKIGIMDDLFELGGDSLTIIQIISRIKEIYPVDISLHVFFENPTIVKLAQMIRELLKGKISVDLKVLPIPKRNVFSPVPLSFAQKRLWVLDRLVPGLSVYNVPTAVQVNGALDLQIFERSINELVRRHESLRTIFRMENEEPVQVILPELHLKINMNDLSHLPALEKDKEVYRCLAEEAGKPFDLVNGPLLRVLLLALDINTNIFMYNVHHIIADTWSNELIMKDWLVIYDAFSAGKPCPFSEPDNIQYADFAVWQKEWLKGDVLEKQLSYWKDILSGDIPILELPTDRPRPIISSYKGRKQEFEIPESLTGQVGELTRKQGCSLFMTMLAAFNVLLYRYSGQEDILVGSPIANRTKPELENIIGFFSNTLVIRTDLGGNPSFNQLLERVRMITTKAYDNQDLPFEKLVEELHPDRYMNHNPFFQAMLVLQNVPKQSVSLENTNIEVRYFPSFSGSVKFDLWLSLSQYGKKISSVIEYSTDIFNDETITRLCGHFINLLEAIVSDPELGINDIMYLSKGEKEQLLSQWNDTGKTYNLQPLHKMFETQVEKTPDHIAVFGTSDQGAFLKNRPLDPQKTFHYYYLTYSKLNEQSDRLAGLLIEKGVIPDTIVAIELERCVEMVIGIMGILKAGGAYLPIDPGLPQDRIDYMLKDSGAMFLVNEKFFRGCRGAVFQKSPLANANLAYLIYTSGSTGKPKGVMVGHEGVSNRLQWMQDTYGLTADDRVLQKTPYSFDVSVWEFFWTLSFGAVLVMAKPGGHRDSAYLVKTINREKITTIHFVPTMLNVFLEDPGVRTIRSLKRVICSGEALPVEYQEKFFKLFDPGVELHNLYGPTEASVDVTYWACERDSGHHTVPIGKPIANTQIYILDKNSQPVPVGIRGELYIGGVQLARGYVNHPELTFEKFNFNRSYRSYKTYIFYKTGDLARWLPDGNIEFLGRLDFQVKVRGFRIELGEIESNLRDNEAAADAVVLVLENLSGAKDRKIVAYVVPDMRYWQGGGQEETVPEDLAGEQITDWQNVFNNTYNGDTGQGDLTFNISGWNSSYTGGPIPAEEMRIWVDRTVERILSYQPQNVMEIGCGTGLFLFRIIPHCRKFLGTDIAQEGLKYINSQLEKIKETNWAEVKTMRRGADNFDGIQPGELDMVILNSVIQYFPSVDYLLDVLEKAAHKIKSGGHIFIGDVRSLPLLKAFHASVELAKAEPGTPKETIMRRVLNKIALEQELAVDPLFFDALKKRIPRIKHVERLLKYGRYSNELSKFRYDIILHIDEEDKELPLVQPDLILEWKKKKLSPMDINDFLSGLKKEGTEPGCIIITGVPNARVVDDIHVLKQLLGIDEPAIVQSFDPNDFLQLEEQCPYQISVSVSPLAGEEGVFDVVFIHRDWKTRMPGAMIQDIHALPQLGDTSNWNSYTNNPILVKIAGRMVPQLRDYLRERVPEYMVPAHFVLLDRLPMTSNGKLDRGMLPEPIQLDQSKDFIEPSTETEIYLAKLWKEILNLERVSVNHNFFELGGDSVNAIQMVSRATKEGLKISVQLLFRNQTIADLANAVEKNLQKTITVGEDTYSEFIKTLDMDAILKQLPEGVEIEDIYPASPLQFHQVHFISQGGEGCHPYLYQKRDVPLSMQLDVEELERIMQITSARYRVLRTVLIWKNLKEPVQVVCKKLKFDFAYHDLAAIPSEEQIPEANKIFKQDWDNTFERNNSSPMRVGVIKLAEDLFQYYFTGDYMRMEGWSASEFTQEILTFYGMIKAGAPIPDQAPPPNCYKEYLHTIRILRNQSENPARQYWRSILKDFKGMNAMTSIPGNRLGQGAGFGVSHFYLPPEVSAQLEKYLIEHRLSVSLLIQGIWAVLLGVYFRQDWVVYGMVTTGRTIPIAGIEHMTGHSINVLPVAVSITKEKPVTGFLKEIQEIQTEWTRYEYTQIEQIKEWLNLPDQALFDHYIVIQNVSSTQGEVRGMQKDSTGWLRRADLVFAKMEYPLRIDTFPNYEYCFIFQYYLRYFTVPAVKGVMDNFRRLMESIIANPHQTVEEWMKTVDIEKYKLYENELPDGFIQK